MPRALGALLAVSAVIVPSTAAPPAAGATTLTTGERACVRAWNADAGARRVARVAWRAGRPAALVLASPAACKVMFDASVCSQPQPTGVWLWIRTSSAWRQPYIRASRYFDNVEKYKRWQRRLARSPNAEVVGRSGRLRARA